MGTGGEQRSKRKDVTYTDGERGEFDGGHGEQCKETSGLTSGGVIALWGGSEHNTRHCGPELALASYTLQCLMNKGTTRRHSIGVIDTDIRAYTSDTPAIL